MPPIPDAGAALMQIVIRAVVLYFFLWLLTRAMGKKELAQLSVFETILAVTIGDLVQQGVTQEDVSVGRAMAYERITLEEIKDAARGQGIVDLHEVRLGILEPGGTFSFLRASDGGARQG